MLKKQEEHDATQEGRPQRKLNHQTGVFLDEPAKQRRRRRNNYASRNQYNAAQQYWGQQYVGAAMAAPGLAMAAGNLNRLHQALRADAAVFVPGGI